MTYENFYRILEVVLKIKEETNAAVNVRGGGGYSATHPYKEKEITPGYGIIDPTKEERPDEDDGPVTVSKAFEED